MKIKFKVTQDKAEGFPEEISGYEKLLIEGENGVLIELVETSAGLMVITPDNYDTNSVHDNRVFTFNVSERVNNE